MTHCHPPFKGRRRNPGSWAAGRSRGFKPGSRRKHGDAQRQHGGVSRQRSNVHALVYLLLLECFSHIHITVILTLPRVWVKHSKKTQETKAHKGRTLLSQKQAIAWLSRPAPSR